ncbi:hypothetical protein [Cupriavidus basilensis]|uniref:hypothetical protein n=1 Tax=Cupriavidus basilensis TaxID=68895 RepID=UPI0023E8F49F|nr:hypothetical protein [Cupriavidus basilensis]MDF3886705.1 hypothetical protein [Cupriavidus basilensis]
MKRASPRAGEHRYARLPMRRIGFFLVTASLLWHACTVQAAPARDLDLTIAEDLYRQAQVAVSNNQPDQASLLLDPLVDLGPDQAGTLLDVAILYCQIGRGQTSKAVLERIRREFAPPDAIRRIIDLRLDEPCMSRPSFYVSVAGGWTSNANSGPSASEVVFAPGAPFRALLLASGSLAQADSFVNLDVGGEIPIPSTEGWSVTGAFSKRQYRAMHAFDSVLASAGVAYRTRLADGLLENSLSAGQYWLGNQPYERHLGLQSGYWFGQTWLLGMPSRFGAELALVDQRYVSNPLYDTIRIEGRAKVEFQPSRFANVLLQVGPVWEKPGHARPGGARAGYSAMLGVNLQLWQSHRITLLFHQQSMQDSEPYSPLFFGATIRRQTSRQISVRYAIPILNSTQFYAQLTKQDVMDSIPIFSYTVSSASLGIAYAY